MTQYTGKLCKEIRREQIADAALRIIHQKGLNGLTTVAIAREAGITKSALHLHFKNKDEILRETVGRIGRELMKNLDYIYDEDPSAVVSLKRFFILHLDYIKANPGVVHLVFSKDMFKADEGLQEKVSDILDVYSTELEVLIGIGKKAGAIRQDVDSAAAALMLIGMVLMMTLKWSLNSYSFPLINEGMKCWYNYELYLTSRVSQPQR